MQTTCSVADESLCALMEELTMHPAHSMKMNTKKMKRGDMKQTRSSWLNCALRDDEAVYCVSLGHFEAVAVGN